MKKYFSNVLLISISLLMLSSSYSQTPTIGLRYTSYEESEGYVLFTPGKNNNVYLVDECGQVVNEWVFDDRPGATCYLLDDGNLLRAGKDNLEIRAWDNTLVWSYLTTENGIPQHHDIEPLPNGNILCVSKQVYTMEELTEAGRDPSITEEGFKLDVIVEIEPVGTEDANIVWEWKFMDHFIQEFDETKENYGVIADHPELMDINFDNGFTIDYTHVNAIDYNAELDQVMLTVRHFSEAIIIDHSTTMEEAAGHTGGNSGRGGDLVWRWGNPQVYQQGSNDDQILFLPHDAKWVEPGYNDYGKISVFNNRDFDDIFSSIQLLSPSYSDNSYEMEDDVFLPLEADWSWHGVILGDTMYENKQSGTHALPNGNFIIAESSTGQITEINRDGDVLWVYRNPSGVGIYTQYEDFPVNENTIFRGEKYPKNFIGFEGKDLTPMGYLENENIISDACILTQGSEELFTRSNYIINPITNNRIQFDSDIFAKLIVITDLSGKTVFTQSNFSGESISIDLKPAMYILKVYGDETNISYKILIQ